jgi:DNA-binding winged helix-turn-helix (wHTH) protein
MNLPETIKIEGNHAMYIHRGTVVAECQGIFEFDYNHNVIYFGGNAIALSPHESDILQVLLTNRARPTPIGSLIQKVYGANEPDAAAASIRVAIHSLRKKIQLTGMVIKAEPGVGYEIDSSHLPELNRRLTDKILLALNVAHATEEPEIAKLLASALSLAEFKRQKWLSHSRFQVPAAVA